MEYLATSGSAIVAAVGAEPACLGPWSIGPCYFERGSKRKETYTKNTGMPVVMRVSGFTRTLYHQH